MTAELATQSLQRLQNSSPWLTFGGIPAPFAGLFNSGGSTLAIIDPNGPSIGQAWPLLPANLKPPVPATNEAQYGYALDPRPRLQPSPRLRRTSATSPRAGTPAARSGPES